MKLAAALALLLLLGCAGCSRAEQRLEGNLQEEWAVPGVGTVTQLLAADVWGGARPELVALAGGNLHVFTGSPEGYQDIFQTAEDPMKHGWHGGRLLCADFDRDGKAEVVRSGKGELSLYFGYKGGFRKLTVQEGITVYDLKAGRFLSGKRPGLAVRAGDGVHVFRVDLLSRKVREVAGLPLPAEEGGRPGWLAVLPVTGKNRESLLMPGTEGGVQVYREGSPLREVSLGQGRLKDLKVLRDKDKNGPLLLALYDERAELYRWNGGEPQKLWSGQHRGGLAYSVDLDRDGRDELVMTNSAYDQEAHRFKGNVLVYSLAEGTPRLLWDSVDTGAFQAGFGDLNGDGRPEIIAGVEAGFRCPDTRKGRIVVYTRTEDSSGWSEAWRGPVYEEGESVFAVADTDGDGAGELYAGNSGNCDNMGTFRMFRAGSGN